MDALEAQAELYDRIFRLFNPLIIEKISFQKRFRTSEMRKNSRSKASRKQKRLLLSSKNNFLLFEPQFKALEQSRIQENDLNLIIQILTFSEEIKVLNERTQKRL